MLGSVPENKHATSTSCAIEKAKLGSILQVTKSGAWTVSGCVCFESLFSLPTYISSGKLRLALKHRNRSSLNLCSFVLATPPSPVDRESGTMICGLLT